MSVLSSPRPTSASCSTWSRASRRWRACSRRSQRDELSMPLRFVFRPAGDDGLMGLMPATAASEPVALLAQGDRRSSPGNSARGLDPIRARCSSTTATTGELRRSSTRRRSPRSGPPPSPARRDAAARAARGANTSRSSAPASRRARTSRRCATVVPDGARCGSGAGRRAMPRRSRSRRHGASPRDQPSRMRSRVQTSCAPARRPASPSSPSSGSLPGTHVNAVGSSIADEPASSHADVVAGASLFVDRRESTLNESGRLPARRRGARESAPTTSARSSGELLDGRPSRARGATTS